MPIRAAWVLALLAMLQPFATVCAGETVHEERYWYRDGRRVALEEVGDGRRDGGAKLYRSAHGGPYRTLGERLYLCVPPTWGEAEVAALAERYALVADGGTERVRRFRVADGGDVLGVANALFEREGVTCAAPLWRKRMGRRSLNDPLLDRQWHLNNTGLGGGARGADVGAFEAWDTTRGGGVAVGVVDDGLEIGHPDLAAAVVTAWSRDHIDNDRDPTAGDHGTAVAGVVAAVGDNREGGAGVAPEASLVGLRVMDDWGMIDESGVADAFGDNGAFVHVLNNSWGPPDDATSAFERPSDLELSAMDRAVRDGRGGLGQIFVWAGGNGGDSDNSNLDGYANLRETIAVTASTNHGTAAYYAEEGANLLVNAPSSGGSFEIVTTDRSGVEGYNSGAEPSEPSDIDYTYTFGGTSSATPAVSGVVALALSVNPNLNWREVQQLLAASAEHNEPEHAMWRRNAAGYWISEQHGFGRVDAAAAVELAAAWGQPLSAEANTWQRYRDVGATIPDDDPQGVTSSILVTDRVRVEFVEVTVDITHSYWGDIALYLTSPSGTEVRLMTSRYLPVAARSLGFDHWVMGDTLHLGEPSRGNWTLRAVDEEGQDVGVLVSWGIRVYGTPLPDASEQLPLGCSPVRLGDGAAVDGAQVRLGGNRHGAALASAVSGSAAEDFAVHLAVAPSGSPSAYLAVVLHTSPEGDVSRYHYTADGWWSWDGASSSLVGFQDEGLDGGAPAALHMGRLGVGSYRIYGGYRDSAGEVVYCPQPLTVEVAGS